MVLWEIITKQAPVRGHLREVRDDEAPPGVQKLLEDCINVDVSVTLSEIPHYVILLPAVCKQHLLLVTNCFTECCTRNRRLKIRMSL